MIEWVSIGKKHPPVDVQVLICQLPSGEDAFRFIGMDRLHYGRGEYQDPKLVYFDDADFDDVSHWAPINYPKGDTELFFEIWTDLIDHLGKTQGAETLRALVATALSEECQECVRGYIDDHYD
jgi:hypothetical protein